MRGANVGGGFLAADVLLAGLQCKAIRWVAVHVHAHADQSTGKGAFVFVAAGHVGRVRAAIAQRHAKTLGGAHHDVGIPLAGRCEQRQGQQIGRHDEGGLFGMYFGDFWCPVVNAATGGGVLRQHAKVLAFQ